MYLDIYHINIITFTFINRSQYKIRPKFLFLTPEGLWGPPAFLCSAGGEGDSNVNLTTSVYYQHKQLTQVYLHATYKP
jgi:hypothetical protein